MYTASERKYTAASGDARVTWSVLVGVLVSIRIDQTFHVVAPVRARITLEIYWRTPGEACPTVKNHCFKAMRFMALC